MMLRLLQGLLLCLPFLFNACQKNTNQDSLKSPSLETQDPKKLRERLNKLLYWQIADELKLSAQEEKSLIKILDDYQHAKEELLKKSDEIMAKVEALPIGSTEDAQSKITSEDFENTQKRLAELDVKQTSDLRQLLGNQRFLSFLKIRKDLNAKLLKAIQDERK